MGSVLPRERVAVFEVSDPAMSIQMSQPISGVSAGTERELMTVYPSISSSFLGKLLGQLYNSIPIGLAGVKVSHLLFPLPTSPIALALYFLEKIFGRKYTLTNRSLQVWSSLGKRMRRTIALADVGDVLVNEVPGQAFYKAADLVILASDGKPILTLDAVPRAEVFRETILKAQAARMQSDATLANIEARQPA